MVMDLGKRDSNRDMWDILPNRCYLEFITKGLGLRCEQGQDPFDLGFFNDLDRGTYVDRPQMQEICRPGNRIILRRQAEDVQSVASATAALLGRSSETLAVELNLTSVEPDSRRGILDGKSSLLSLEPLLRKIFDVYWEHLISLHSDILRVFCNDDQWRRMLRWFYKRCPLSTPNVDIPVLKECVTGLQNGADPSRTSLRDTFDRLIKLVTYSASYSDFTGEKRKYQLYEWITVVLDDRQLSSAAMNPLLTDFETSSYSSIRIVNRKSGGGIGHNPDLP
jgi:hypothetical protein